MTTIGVAAREAGCNVETIRYYERIGLVDPPPRARNGRRSYGPVEIERLKFIRRCRGLDFNLKEVQTLIGLSASKGESCGEVRQLAESQIKSVRQKMADLAGIETWLAQTIKQCASGERDGCPMIDKLTTTPT